MCLDRYILKPSPIPHVPPIRIGISIFPQKTLGKNYFLFALNIRLEKVNLMHQLKIRLLYWLNSKMTYSRVQDYKMLKISRVYCETRTSTSCKDNNYDAHYWLLPTKCAILSGCFGELRVKST